MAVRAPAGSSLELADAVRLGTATAPPFELWQAADHESAHIPERLEHFRHAMVHAGHIRTKAGGAYRRCPVCRRSLP